MRNYSEDTPHRADRTIDTHAGPITGTRIRLSAREQRCTGACLGIDARIKELTRTFRGSRAGAPKRMRDTSSAILLVYDGAESFGDVSTLASPTPSPPYTISQVIPLTTERIPADPNQN